MMSVQRPHLRGLIHAGPLVVMPGVYDAVSAMLAAEAGFDALYLSGGLSASSFPGLADFGTRTLTEATAQIAGVTMAVGLPILADGEAGFGSILSVQRLVREMERAGAAGIHLEDQDEPRRCGHAAGKRLVSATEHAGRIRAAVEARTDPEFVIVARTDAVAVSGFADALDRCRQYIDAGADAIFIEGMDTMEQLREAPRLFSVPVFANMPEGGDTPFLSAPELAKLGYAVVIYPTSAYLAAFAAMREVLRVLKATGTTKPLWDRMATLRDWHELTGVPAITQFIEEIADFQRELARQDSGRQS